MACLFFNLGTGCEKIGKMNHPSYQTQLQKTRRQEASNEKGSSLAPPPFQLKATSINRTEAPDSQRPEDQQKQSIRPNVGSWEHSLEIFSQEMGEDFSNIKFQTESSQAKQLNALAYTQGEEIHFAPGQFKPNTEKGIALIGHELTHVKQQRRQNVQANTQIGGKGVNTDKGLEAEADTMGAKLVQAANNASFQLQKNEGHQSINASQGEQISHHKSSTPIQRQADLTCNAENQGPGICEATPQQANREFACELNSAPLTKPHLTRIFVAGGLGNNAERFTETLSTEEINQASCLSQEAVAADDLDRTEHQTGGRATNRSLPIHWNAQISGLNNHISPLANSGQATTLGDAYRNHRTSELSRMVGQSTTPAMVMAARILAQNHNADNLAESARRLLFIANEYAIINTLNPAQSRRYWESGDTTYCNIYVRDLLKSMGVTSRAIPGGNANSLAAYMARATQYWRRLDGPDLAQNRANQGRIVIITAQGNNNNPGHISLVPAENMTGRGTHAHRDAEGHVDSPLESNAGGGETMRENSGEVRPTANFRYANRHDLYSTYPTSYRSRNDGPNGRPSRHPQWWANGHTNGGFYEYIGPFNNDDAVASTSVLGTQ